jgi:hypothetical protein
VLVEVHRGARTRTLSALPVGADQERQRDRARERRASRAASVMQVDHRRASRSRPRAGDLAVVERAAVVAAGHVDGTRRQRHRVAAPLERAVGVGDDHVVVDLALDGAGGRRRGGGALAALLLAGGRDARVDRRRRHRDLDRRGGGPAAPGLVVDEVHCDRAERQADGEPDPEFHASLVPRHRRAAWPPRPPWRRTRWRW